MLKEQTVRLRRNVKNKAPKRERRCERIEGDISSEREREGERGREREREIERDSLFSICWMGGKDSDASLSHISPKWTLSARTLLFFVSTFQSKTKTPLENLCF